MRVLSIASGSRGNATLVEEGGRAVLVDCGVPLKLLAGLEFEAVLVTHSHADHVSGLEALLRHRDVPVYANAMTAESIAHDCGVDDASFACFENGQPFEIGPFTVEPFPVPHDTSDPVGYLIRAEDCAYFHATDVGTPLESIGRMLARADIATLESNHDAVLLRQSGRPERLIRRIAGPRGHLSNDEACELVHRFASPRLKRLGLAHLSRDCNDPKVAEATMRSTLAAMNRSDVSLRVFRQDGTVEL